MDRLPFDFVKTEIIERFDVKELYRFGATCKEYYRLVTDASFIEAYAKRRKPCLWLLTHCLTENRFYHGILRCTRMDDLSGFALDIEQIFRWVKSDNLIKLISAEGNFVVFMLYPINACFVVVNLLLRTSRRIPCPATVFPNDWFRKRFILESQVSNNGYHLTFVQLIEQTPLFLETEVSPGPVVWVRRDCRLSELKDKVGLYIASEDKLFLNKVSIRTESDLCYNKIEIGLDNLIAMINLTRDVPFTGLQSRMDWVYNSFGKLVVYETQKRESRQLQMIYVFKIHVGGFEMVSSLPTQHLMSNLDDLISISVDETEQHIVVIVQSKKMNHLDTFRTYVFLYNVQDNVWITRRLGDFRSVDAYQPLYTHLAIYDRRTTPVWPPMAILANRQMKENRFKKMKYLQHIVYDSPFELLQCVRYTRDQLLQLREVNVNIRKEIPKVKLEVGIESFGETQSWPKYEETVPLRPRARISEPDTRDWKERTPTPVVQDARKYTRDFRFELRERVRYTRDQLLQLREVNVNIPKQLQETEVEFFGETQSWAKYAGTVPVQPRACFSEPDTRDCRERALTPVEEAARKDTHGGG